MDNLKERVDAIIAKVSDLKRKSRDTDALVAELGKVRDKLPKEAKDALDKHAKQKAGKKND